MTMVFDKCCGCIGLRTGSFIIASLNLAGNLILIALDAVILVAYSKATNNYRLTSDEQMFAYIVYVVACVMMFLLMVFLIFAIVLLVGIQQEKRGHVKAYLVFATILLVILIIQFLASFALLPIRVWNIITDAIGIVLNTYFLLCIRSYYLKMGEQSPTPIVYNVNQAYI